jgi:hypothetical protein
MFFKKKFILTTVESRAPNKSNQQVTTKNEKQNVSIAFC